MKESQKLLNILYGSSKAVTIPGSGTFSMETVARQYSNQKKTLVIRNGNFSYRWEQILKQGNITNNLDSISADISYENEVPIITPPKLDYVIDYIKSKNPAIVFMPHVETSNGIMLSDKYIKEIGISVRKCGGLLCLDCIASGANIINMMDNNIDIIISAPQKGWSGAAGFGIILLGDRAIAKMNEQSSSFSMDLRKWLEIAEAYEKNTFKYHCTPPTDTLLTFHHNLLEFMDGGFNTYQQKTQELGTRFLATLEKYGYQSVVKKKYQANTVIVVYDKNNTLHKLNKEGVRVTGYSPWMLDEPEGINTFRIGLFGIDKLNNIDKTVNDFENALKSIQL